VGSISKVVTATAMMQLWEQELFDLDEDINNYLPFNIRNPNYPDDPITFRMLLAHQSSIFEWLETSSLNYLFSDNDYSFIEEILLLDGSNYHSEYWADYPPGSEKNYSNFGYILLGYLIEQITGDTFDKYCNNHIFKPLGMYNTSFKIDDLNQSNIANPYYWIGGIYIPIKKTDHLFIDPCGGLFTTVEDLSHLFIAHLNNGEFNGVRILEESTIDLMHTPQYPESRWAGNYQYGIGWAIINNQNDETIMVGHSGGLICYSSMMYYFLNDNVSIIYMVNSGSDFISREYQIPLPSLFLQNYAFNRILLLLMEKGINLHI
jgi:CubicO group peptidase (beta-lactamase class C family)